MRFGLFGGVARGGDQLGDSRSYEDFIDYVVEAERLGFEAVFLVEHHFTGNGQLSASLTFLSYLAGVTSKIRLGTAVTVMPWHNPVLLAEQAAIVDLVSKGRLDFGVGRGYRPNEFHGFCIAPEEAQARYEEGFEVLIRSWTSAERFSHSGKFWQYRDIVVEPQCLQSPHPPIWVAGGSETTIRAAARRGQRLLLDQFGDADLTRQRVAYYYDELAKAGFEREEGCVAVTRGLLLTEDDDAETREREIARRLDLIESLKATSRIPGTAPEQDVKSFVDDTRAATESSTILGSPAECITRLRALEDAGVDYVLFNDPWGGVDRLRLFAEKVMPAFSASKMAPVVPATLSV